MAGIHSERGSMTDDSKRFPDLTKVRRVPITDELTPHQVRVDRERREMAQAANATMRRNTNTNTEEAA
jgi:hypothetical protein